MLNQKENLCNKCPPNVRGICCYFMEDLEGSLFTLTKHPCKFLNENTKRCSIYTKRKEINPNCLTLEEMYINGAFPKECLYVKNDRDYQERADTRKAPIIHDKELLETYVQTNERKHEFIATYETLRSFICPRCKSGNLVEEWDDKYSILFCSYTCVECKHSWNNFNKQVLFTINLIKQERKTMEEILNYIKKKVKMNER